MSFEQITNSITAYFQNFADVSNLVARYDNDPRDTPSSRLWCKCSVEFDAHTQKEIGVNSYKCTGNFIIEIFDSLRMGTAYMLNKIDLIVAQFTELIINNLVEFQTPTVRNVGRVNDNYRIDVICSFEATLH